MGDATATGKPGDDNSASAEQNIACGLVTSSLHQPLTRCGGGFLLQASNVLEGGTEVPLIQQARYLSAVPQGDADAGNLS
jgi:hypothetical protein